MDNYTNQLDCLLTTIKVQGQQVEVETITNSTISTISFIFQCFHVGSLPFFYLLLTSMSLYMYILATHHHQFTSWVADLIFLIVCLILSLLTAITFLVILSLPNQSPALLPIQVINFIIISLATVGFTVLTLVPMCCRACDYNLCMRSVATRESHQQALREILPLFILLSPNVAVLASVLNSRTCLEIRGRMGYKHRNTLASSPGSLRGFTGNTGGGAARNLVRTVRACANNPWNVGNRILIVYVCYRLVDTAP